ncbi:MAG: hypothetical protein LKM44_02060, partial [Wolbachia endosymbiont of Meromenopon meropis]|nr:hypothetical protein [Wolbachia endosymbiont of Meromenopon meropis]
MVKVEDLVVFSEEEERGFDRYFISQLNDFISPLDEGDGLRKSESVLRRSSSDSGSSDTTVRAVFTRRSLMPALLEVAKNEGRLKKQNLRDLLKRLKSFYSGDIKIRVKPKRRDCFFDSIAQALNQLRDRNLLDNDQIFDVKLLRKDCADYARENADKDSWIYKKVTANMDDYFFPQENFLSSSCFGDSKNKKKSDISDVREETFSKYLDHIKNVATKSGPIPIWGSPEIEGQIISNKYNVVLYFYSTTNRDDQKITVTKVTPGSTDLEIFVEGENFDQLYLSRDDNKKVVNIVNYKEHFLPLFGDFVPIKKNLISKKETDDLWSNFFDQKIREYFNLEEQKLQLRVQLNQNFFPAVDVYNQLRKVKFDDYCLYECDSGAWASMDRINSYINDQAIKIDDKGNELAYYIGPSNFGFNSKEGIEDIAKHICRREGVLNSFYGNKKSLDKPFIVISNIETVLAQSSTDVNQEGGIHWVSWVLLPKHYLSLSGKEIDNNKYQVFFFDSLSEQSFPEGLKKFLMEGGEIIEETDEGIKRIHLMPFCEKNEIDFCNLKEFTGQQRGVNGNDCGWWAVYYALMAVYTGGVEFLVPLRGRKLSAMPLRKIINLQETASQEFSKNAPLKNDSNVSLSQEKLCENNEAKSSQRYAVLREMLQQNQISKIPLHNVVNSSQVIHQEFSKNAPLKNDSNVSLS